MLPQAGKPCGVGKRKRRWQGTFLREDVAQPMGSQTQAADLEAELRRRERELAAIHRITSALSSQIELPALVKQTLEVCMETVGAAAGSVLLYDRERDELVFRYVVGEKADELTGMGLPPSRGICGEVFRSGLPKISEDVSKDLTHARDVSERIHYETRNMVTVPLKSVRGQPIGVMQILNKAAGDFDEEDLELLNTMGQQAAMAIETARLHEEARLAVVVKLMGDISHDIKNMITPVQTAAETLDLMLDEMYQELDQALSRPQGDPQEALERARQATEFVRDFYPEATEMFMDGSAQVQERVREIADCVKGIVAQPAFELRNVNDVVQKVAKPLALLAEKSGVRIRTDELGDVPEALVDEKQLYNAIYNLVNNAVPETPEGGEISVRTSAVTEGEFPEGSYVMIEVADTGRGMPPEVKARLFTDDAVSTKPGGTGLGTRIVKNVVTAHGGTIHVESQPGQGSTFYLKLPLSTAPV